MNESIKKPSIFRRLFERREQISDLKNPKEWLFNALGIRKTLTGVNVTETSAMNLSSVYACVRIISEDIASLPLNIYKRLNNGKEKATKHPLYRALHLRPNPDMTSFVWRELMGVQLTTWGNSYNYKLRNIYGDVIGFYPLLANRMKVEIKDNEIIYAYTFNDNIQRQVPRKDILHIPGLGFNGIIGQSPIAMMRETIGLGFALEEFGARFFSNSTNVGGVAHHPGQLTKQGSENLRDSINEVYQGLGSSHKLLLLEEGMTYEKVTIPPNDAQFLETRVFQLEEVCRFYKMQLHKVQDLKGATFSNIEHLAIEYVVDTLRPWLVRIEQSINSDDELFNDEYFCEFVIDGLLRGDTQARFEAYTKAIQNGIYSPNNVLEMENKNGYEGGDKHFVQLNMQTVEDIGKLIDGTREIIVNGTEIRVVPKEIKAIESRDLNQKLSDRLQKAYEPLFVNALIRVIKREKVDVLKIAKDEFSLEDLKNYYEKHSVFVNSQIKPAIYAFSGALYESFNDKKDDEAIEIVSIFTEFYTNDFVDSYIEDCLYSLETFGIAELESKFKDWLENKPQVLTLEALPKISTAFSKYIEKIGGNGTQ